MQFFRLSGDRRKKLDFKLLDIFSECNKTRDTTKAKRQINALQMTYKRKLNKTTDMERNRLSRKILRLDYAKKIFE